MHFLKRALIFRALVSRGQASPLLKYTPLYEASRQWGWHHQLAEQNWERGVMRLIWTQQRVHKWMCVSWINSVLARVIRVYAARITSARFPPLELGACFVSAICHVDRLIIRGGMAQDTPSHTGQKNFIKPNVNYMHAFETIRQWDNEIGERKKHKIQF